MARPIFTRWYELLSRAEDPMIRRFRDETAGRARGRVLELGAGNGLNFSRYRDVEVVALEPEEGMLRKARSRAAEAPVPVRLVRGVAERLPFADGTFDTVVLSLVMCSVPDPRSAAAEVRRVLAEGGEVRFFEHVRSPAPRAARRQDLVVPFYSRFSGGCHVNRDTLGTLRNAGFRVRYRRLAYGPRHAPHVIGVASRP